MLRFAQHDSVVFSLFSWLFSSLIEGQFAGSSGSGVGGFSICRTPGTDTLLIESKPTHAHC
jgi:hypothetical protein